MICTLGNFATKLLSGSSVGITRCCGQPQEREVAGLPVTLYPLFHPAAALRTPSVLERLRADFARIPELIEQARPGEPEPALAAAAAAPPSAEQLDLLG